MNYTIMNSKPCRICDKYTQNRGMFMKKRIYVYQNDTDIIQFLRYLMSLEVPIYSYYGEKIDIVNYRPTHNREFLYIVLDPPHKKNMACFVDDSMEHIVFTTPFYTGQLFQCGSFSIYTKTNSSLLNTIFSLLRKYINVHYTKSDNKQYYVGPDILQDWKAGLVDFPDLFKSEKLVVSSDDFSFVNFIEFIEGKGLCISENGKDIRTDNSLNLLAIDYVIYPNKSNLKVDIRSREKYYLTGSECVFLHISKQKNKNIYTFELDSRFNCYDYPNLYLLFNIIATYLSNH